MRQLTAKHPDGLAGFKGDLTPTESFNLGSPTEDKTFRHENMNSEAIEATSSQINKTEAAVEGERKEIDIFVAGGKDERRDENSASADQLYADAWISVVSREA